MQINLEIDDKIIENCEILQDNNDIKGIISYEKFNEIGLIRYFIFKRNLDLDSLALLYQGLEKNMRDDYVRIVIGIVNSKTIKDVFEYIGFKESNPSLLYFDENRDRFTILVPEQSIKTDNKNELSLNNCKET